MPPEATSPSTWKDLAKDAISKFREDGMTDWAAALTYYAILAIFPGLIVMISVLGLIGPAATDPLIENVRELAPGPARDIFLSAIKNLQGGQGTAGIVFVIGLLAAFWSASGYIGAFSKAANVVWDAEDERPIHHAIGLRLGITFLMMVMMALSAFGIVLSGGIARSLGDAVGVGGTAVTIWGYAKWPVIMGIVTLMFSVLYFAAPNGKRSGFRIATVGGFIAVCVWLLASAAFAFYVSNFGSYNKTYGALGGAITFLVWLWLTNLAVLLGAQFDAAIERRKGNT